jgi:predicted nucleotidyltransferase
MTLDYRTIFKNMNEAGVDYIIVGGLAVNFYGVPRMTYDLDLMIDLNPENILKLVSRFSAWGYQPRAPVDPRDLADEKKKIVWIQEKNRKAFSFYHDKEAIGEIDVLIDSPVPYEALRKRARVSDVEGTGVPVVSVQDLIDLKLRAGRQQDLSDAEHLNTILEEK